MDKEFLHFALDIDWLTTNEFCDKFSIPVPRWAGNAQALADQVLHLDAIKYKMLIDKAKEISRRKPEEVKPENKVNRWIKITEQNQPKPGQIVMVRGDRIGEINPKDKNVTGFVIWDNIKYSKAVDVEVYDVAYTNITHYLDLGDLTFKED